MKPGIIPTGRAPIKVWHASLCVLTLALASSGCAGASGRGWGADRLRDLADVVTLTASLGPGLGFHVGATRLVQVGAGVEGSDQLRVLRLGAVGRDAGIWTEQRLEGGLSVFYFNWLDRRPLLGSVGALTTDAGPPRLVSMGLDASGDNDRGHFDVGLHAHVGLLGFSVALRLGELVDLLAGLIGFDLVGDDGEVGMTQPPKTPETLENTVSETAVKKPG